MGNFLLFHGELEQAKENKKNMQPPANKMHVVKDCQGDQGPHILFRKDLISLSFQATEKGFHNPAVTWTNYSHSDIQNLLWLSPILMCESRDMEREQGLILQRPSKKSWLWAPNLLNFGFNQVKLYTGRIFLLNLVETTAVG